MAALSWWSIAPLGGWCIYVASILGIIIWIGWEIYQADKHD